MIIKEFKFIGLLIFIIFAILLLIGLICLVTYQRFNCSEYINYMGNISISDKIENILPYLQTGDIIIRSGCLIKSMNNIKCFIKSRGNFIKNTYDYTHISLIYRKGNTIYLIENISNNHHCSSKKSLVNSKYNGGLRIVNFEKYIKETKESTKTNKYCCKNYGIRFINRKLNQSELNKRLEKEFNILTDTKFTNLNNLRVIASSGWFIKDMPNDFNYSLEIFYPQDEKDTFFCSEMIGVLLQRIGVMKRKNRARMFYPADYNGEMDDYLFEKNMYSSIKIYE